MDAHECRRYQSELFACSEFDSEYVQIMSMTVQQIVAEAKKLSSEEQAELIDLLWSEAVGGPDPEIDEAWKQETRRRIVEIEEGRVEGVPAEVVSAKARKIVGL